MRNGKGFDAILESDEIFLTPQEVGKAAGWSPDLIITQARTHPELLGFPVACIGTRTYIPRIPYLEFCGLLDKARELERRKLSDLYIDKLMEGET